jgi:hypothetical protein
MQVVEGQEAAQLVDAWVSSAYLDRLRVEVSLVLTVTWKNAFVLVLRVI